MSSYRLQNAYKSLQRVFRHAALWPALVLISGCGSLALQTEDVPDSGPQPAYVSLAASYLTGALKDHASYDAFEISNLRWVDSLEGWNWVACVHFRDHGHQRTYVLFIQGNSVVDGRYAVETDACGTQSYTQFDLLTGVRGRPTAAKMEPLY